jgi:hypothetical protein
MMKMFLEAIEKALPLVRWEPTDGPKEHDAKFFQGMAEGWSFTITSFDIENQGFPPGSRGYDGAAASGKAIVRLTRELAEKAFKLAEAQT